jgi:hypothetical protein
MVDNLVNLESAIPAVRERIAKYRGIKRQPARRRDAFLLPYSDPYWLCGTVTVALALEVFPAASVAW